MRVIAHMVVGPGEAERYLDQTLTRIQLWADLIYCAIDARASTDEFDVVRYRATHWQVLGSTWEDHEGKFRQAAWASMEQAVNPTGQDFILAIDADEVVHDYAMVQLAAREYPNSRIGFKFHEMWSPTHYRVDGKWKPYEAFIMFPYKPSGIFKDRPIACGREPTYVGTLPIARVVSDMLHYGYARPGDRKYKLERYMRLDGGKYHDVNHLRSIGHTPALEPWIKGGLLDV